MEPFEHHLPQLSHFDWPVEAQATKSCCHKLCSSCSGTILTSDSTVIIIIMIYAAPERRVIRSVVLLHLECDIETALTALS